jgi:hypothetical protein
MYGCTQAHTPVYLTLERGDLNSAAMSLLLYFFSARHLNSDRELLYSLLFLKYMRYKHETFTKMILKYGFIIFLFNNISALYLSSGSG